MRARNIKPGFFKNEYLAELDPLTRILFIGLWCFADKEGRFEWRPKKIKAEILPYDNGEVTVMLQELHGQGFVKRYRAGENKEYDIGEVVNFKKHQSPHHTEKASELPGLDVNGYLTVNSPLRDGENPSDSLIPDSLIPDSKTYCPDTSLHDVPGQVATGEPVECEKHDPEVIRLPTNTGDGYPVTESQVASWSGIYGNVDVHQELKAMFAWLDARPGNQRKTKAGMKKFIVSWLNRGQDKARVSAAVRPNGNGNGKAEARRRDWDALPIEMKHRYAGQYAEVLDDSERQQYLQ